MGAKKAITITELKEIADKHLDNVYANGSRSGAPYRRIARHPGDAIYVGQSVFEAAKVIDMNIVEFRADLVRLCSLDCTAWFYGDVLVKVAV